ncbi:hypothetical protein P0136_10170 [Lentisphaerota bacterium ZTH]|nr:hypothetical protein JYG24_12320 [Lentisphaerota bacterium]WET05726.1 hypothetical protein P0136_10170 [Lentisphaerota bacterium ZTH]
MKTKLIIALLLICAGSSFAGARTSNQTQKNSKTCSAKEPSVNSCVVVTYLIGSENENDLKGKVIDLRKTLSNPRMALIFETEGKMSMFEDIEYFEKAADGRYILKKSPVGPGWYLTFIVEKLSDQKVLLKSSFLTKVLTKRIKLKGVELDVGRPVYKEFRVNNSKGKVIKFNKWQRIGKIIMENCNGRKRYLAIFVLVARNLSSIPSAKNNMLTLD